MQATTQPQMQRYVVKFRMMMSDAFGDLNDMEYNELLKIIREDVSKFKSEVNQQRIDVNAF